MSLAAAHSGVGLTCHRRWLVGAAVAFSWAQPPPRASGVQALGQRRSRGYRLRRGGNAAHNKHFRATTPLAKSTNRRHRRSHHVLKIYRLESLTTPKLKSAAVPLTVGRLSTSM